MIFCSEQMMADMQGQAGSSEGDLADDSDSDDEGPPPLETA
jgi:hypothetical protein